MSPLPNKTVAWRKRTVNSTWYPYQNHSHSRSISNEMRSQCVKAFIIDFSFFALTFSMPFFLARRAHFEFVHTQCKRSYIGSRCVSKFFISCSILECVNVYLEAITGNGSYRNASIGSSWLIHCKLKVGPELPAVRQQTMSLDLWTCKKECGSICANCHHHMQQYELHWCDQRQLDRFEFGKIACNATKISSKFNYALHFRSLSFTFSIFAPASVSVDWLHSDPCMRLNVAVCAIWSAKLLPHCLRSTARHMFRS